MLSSKTYKMLKNILLTLTIMLSSISFAKSDLSTDNVITAINCGGDSFTDSKGVFYEKVFFSFLKILILG